MTNWPHLGQKLSLLIDESKLRRNLNKLGWFGKLGRSCGLTIHRLRPEKHGMLSRLANKDLIRVL
jgi:hypothetical protein